MSNPNLTDILVIGATGFTGKLVVRHLASHPDYTSTPRKFTFGIGARSLDRLAKVAEEYSLSEQDVPRVSVDTANKDQVDAAVRTARVVINVVGPFWKYSKLVVKSCAEQGVHYVDLTGEPHFMKYVIDECDEPARASGAILIPASGQDSVPSEVLVFLANKTLKGRFPNRSLTQSTTAFDVHGAISGGTLATIFSMFEDVSMKTRGKSRGPWALSPVKGVRQPLPRLIYELPYSTVKGGYWLMSTVDVAVVLRTWGLLQRAATENPQDAEAQQRTYGPQFTYDEFMVASSKITGALLTLALFTTLFLSAFPPTRWLLKRIVAQPGSGPSEYLMEEGYLKATNVSISTPDPTSGKRAIVRTHIHGRGDPGYTLASIMIAESALALIFDRDSLPPLGRSGGALTPASALGDVIVRRMERTGRWKVESEVVGEDI